MVTLLKKKTTKINRATPDVKAMYVGREVNLLIIHMLIFGQVIISMQS